MKQARINITKFFTQPSFANIAISVVTGGLLWFLFNTQNAELTNGVSTMFMKHYVLWTLPGWTSRVLGFIVMLGLMIWLMFLCEELQIIPVRSSMPLTVGIVIASCVSYIQPFDESYITAILFLIALKQLIQMYHFESQVAAGYNIVLLLGVASLFEPAYIWLSLLFVLGMVIFRVITQRVFFSILLGITTLFVVVGSLFWLVDELDVLINYLYKLVNVSLWHNVVLSKADILIACFTGGLILFAFIGYYFRPSNYKLNTRLNFAFINWGFWLSVIWVVLFASNFAQLIAIPGLFAIMCLSLYFSTNQSKVANMLFVVWFLVFVAYRVIF